MGDAFTQFEHEGWERVAARYDSTWSSSTRQFIEPLLDAAEVSAGVSVLDVGSGPGYVSAACHERAAIPVGIDFSSEMVAIARKMFPQIQFREGDAQNLAFSAERFDRVLSNFALLHLSNPERAMAEACRVLKPGGKFGFTTWAKREENCFVQIVDDALQAHGDLNVELPPGPPYYLHENVDGFRAALEAAGFSGSSMAFKIHTIEWKVPTPRFVFDVERNAGVRTAGVLAGQSPEQLNAIRTAIETAVERYATGDGFAIPMAAYVVAVSKK